MKKSRAATRTVNILELIAKESKGLTLSEIAIRLEIPITSVSDIVKALLDSEMLELLDERSKLYGIGVKAYYIGNAFIVNTSLVDKAKAPIEELSHDMGKTVFLGKVINGKITYIYKYEPENNLVTTCDVGSRTSLHCTSLGKSILAFNSELLDSLEGVELTKRTAWTITDFKELKKDVSLVRERGYSIDDKEQNDHLLCVGAPIFDGEGKVIAALSVSGLCTGVVDVESEGQKVKEAALRISYKMGYVG